MAYEQKPNTFSLFKDDDDRINERKKFYREKGWEEASVPTYSGRFVLENGETLNIEAKIIDGSKGKFFSGRAWKKKTDGASAPSAPAPRNDDPLDDDVPF